MRLSPLLLSLCLPLSLLAASSAQAQSVNIGRALFNAQCADAGCHTGTLPRLANNGIQGANNASAIQRAIQSDKGGMGYLKTLSSTDLADIAYYLGNYSKASSSLSEADRLLNWAEWTFQALLTPRAASEVISGYTVRKYASANLWIGIANGQVYTYVPSSGKLDNIGSSASFLSTAASYGF